MRTLFALFLLLHGAIHLMGFAKAWGLAKLPSLTTPISRGAGLAWLAAALLLLATAVALAAWPSGWWMLGAAALLASQAALLTSWREARYGSFGNLVLLVGVVYGVLSHGPSSFRAEYDREAAKLLARPVKSAVITEADLVPLPEPVRRYLRLTGAVGKERVRNFRATFRGQLRGGPKDPWMEITAEEVEAFDEPARLFLVDASRYGLPVQAFHAYLGPSATFRVKIASAFTVTEARGAEMDRSETVTLFNDMCLLAPATLVDPAIRWEPVDAHTARATFTNAGQTIRAELTFDEEGELVNFVSDDRSMASPDGKTFEKRRWSTPAGDYGGFGQERIAYHAEARWGAGESEFTYARFDVVKVEYNVGR